MKNKKLKLTKESLKKVTEDTLKEVAGGGAPIVWSA